MNRRQFARNTIGALVGFSAVPAAFEKPLFRPCLPEGVYIPPVNAGAKFITQEYLTKVRDALVLDTPEAHKALESYIKEMPARAVPADISDATKIHLKEMWG
jgi:hypothetical protein